MKNNIINQSLKKDLKEVILKEPTNILEIKIGEVSGHSIEVSFKEPLSFSSYVYYENEDMRNADFKELELIIKNESNDAE